MENLKVIVGLGNPGREYAETRHNVGFLVVDGIAEACSMDFRPKYQGLLAEGRLDGRCFLLFKPQTFMNLSGRAVRDMAAFFKIPAQEILVVHDDMDLACGKIRFRERGSSGGHNGIRSLIGELGSEEFWRLKIGVGRPPAEWDPARYVLAPFQDDEIPILEEVLARAEKGVGLWLEGKGSQAMNLYNK